MRIKFSKKLPPINEISNILSAQFADRYTVRKFGVGNQSLLIGKSTLVGAEVSVNGNEITLASSPPSVFGTILMTVGATELGVFLFPFLFKDMINYKSRSRTLIKEIGLFLKKSLN
ncbi:MAG: hypothetical protein AAFQ94_05240 [Bacteroidota bacterium]